MHGIYGSKKFRLEGLEIKIKKKELIYYQPRFSKDSNKDILPRHKS